MSYRLENGDPAGFDPYAIAEHHGQVRGINRSPKESDDQYRSRVAGFLRSEGQIRAAHEAFIGTPARSGEKYGADAGMLGAQILEREGIELPKDPVELLELERSKGVELLTNEEIKHAFDREIDELLETS